MSRKFRYAIAFLGGAACAWAVLAFRALSYEDCLLRNVKASMTKEAAFIIRNACENKFKNRPAKFKNRPASEYWRREASSWAREASSWQREASELRTQLTRLRADSASRARVPLAARLRARLDSVVRVRLRAQRDSARPASPRPPDPK